MEAPKRVVPIVSIHLQGVSGLNRTSAANPGCLAGILDCYHGWDKSMRLMPAEELLLGFPDLVQDLVVEVVSPSDTAGAVQAKLEIG